MEVINLKLIKYQCYTSDKSRRTQKTEILSQDYFLHQTFLTELFSPVFLPFIYISLINLLMVVESVLFV